jgi:hypothetical protein
VYQNGVKLSEADYTSTSGTAIVLAQGASVSDIVEVVVYDVFSVADTVSKSAGGTFDGNVTMAGTLDVAGVATATTFEPDGDTAAGDNAAIGFTSAEGLILTGQGSTSDITVKNDADATVFTVPTGTDDILFPDNAKVMFGAGSDLQIFHDGTNSNIKDAGTGSLNLIASTMVQVQGVNGETMALFNEDGAVELRHNDVKKFETQSDGCKTHGVHRIAADASNAYALSVVNDGNNPNRYGISIQTGEDTPSTVNYLMGFSDGNGSGVGSITFNNAGQTQFNASSDYRLKENVTEDWDATTRLKELKPCRFNFKKYPNITLDGFIAHEAQEVVPEAVVGEKDAVDDNGNPMYQGIDQSKIVPLLTKTILELEARITALESK